MVDTRALISIGPGWGYVEGSLPFGKKLNFVEILLENLMKYTLNLRV